MQFGVEMVEPENDENDCEYMRKMVENGENIDEIALVRLMMRTMRMLMGITRMPTSFVTEGDELRWIEEGPRGEEVEEEEDKEAGWEASRVEIGTIRSFLALPWKLARIRFCIGINFCICARSHKFPL